MVRDPGGYMWLGTHDGLDRFDRRQFKTFKIFKNANKITSLLVSTRGTLWIGSEGGGVACYLLPGGGIHHKSSALSGRGGQCSPGDQTMSNVIYHNGKALNGIYKLILSTSLREKKGESQYNLCSLWFFFHTIVFQYHDVGRKSLQITLS